MYARSYGTVRDGRILALDRLEQAVRHGERGGDRIRPGTRDDSILRTAATHPVTAFHHVWAAETIAGLVACLALPRAQRSRCFQSALGTTWPR
jgi:hypothetical protein